MSSPDKCTERIGIAVTPTLKIFYDDLPEEFKKRAKKRIIQAIEETIHESRFKKGMYSGDEHE